MKREISFYYSLIFNRKDTVLNRKSVINRKAYVIGKKLLAGLKSPAVSLLLSKIVRHQSTEFRSTMLRVFICGAHSVGKTTLVNKVGKEMNLHIQAEVARNVIKDLKLRREDFDPKINPAKFEELQEKILEAQCKAEECNSRNETPYIADRGIDPLIYSLVYLGEESMKRLSKLPSAKECINRYVI